MKTFLPIILGQWLRDIILTYCNLLLDPQLEVIQVVLCTAPPTTPVSVKPLKGRRKAATRHLLPFVPRFPEQLTHLTSRPVSSAMLRRCCSRNFSAPSSEVCRCRPLIMSSTCHFIVVIVSSFAPRAHAYNVLGAGCFVSHALSTHMFPSVVCVRVRMRALSMFPWPSAGPMFAAVAPREAAPGYGMDRITENHICLRFKSVRFLV